MRTQNNICQSKLNDVLFSNKIKWQFGYCPLTNLKLLVTVARLYILYTLMLFVVTLTTCLGYFV